MIFTLELFIQGSDGHNYSLRLIIESKSIHHDVLLWDKEIPPEDQNNSSETRLFRVSDEIIQVRGWDFLVPQQYIMMDTFSRPLFDFLRFYMNSVSSA